MVISRLPKLLGVAFTAALALGTAKAQVCDPEVASNLEAPGALRAPVVLGSSAYVPAGQSGIDIIDVTDPTQPVLLGTQSTSGEAYEAVLEFFERKLIIANGAAGIARFTISGDGSLGGAEFFPLSGKTSISIDGSGGRYAVGTMEGDVMLVTLGSGTSEVEATVNVGGPVRSVVTIGSKAYCAAGSAGLVAVDFGAEEPGVIASIDLGGDVVALSKEGDRLFAGVDGVGLVMLRATSDSLIRLAALELNATPFDIVAWGGRVYVTMPSEGVAAIDSSLENALLLLGETDLPGSEGLALVGDYVFVGKGTQGFSAVDISSCADAGVSPRTLYVPAAARATGAASTYWVTDVAIANLTSASASCNLAYLVKGQANPTPENVSVVLAPGEQLYVFDVFGELFGMSSANGALRLTVSHPDVNVTTRTYNAAGESGTYGQFIPAIGEEDALQPGVAGSLTQLAENDAFRTNIGLLNITPLDEVEVDIDLYQGTGNKIWTEHVTLSSYEMIQINRIFRNAGVGSVDNGFAVVKVKTEDAKVLAYASLVDNQSGDAIFIPAEPLTPGNPFASTGE